MWAKTYFAWDERYNPLHRLDRWLNPYRRQFEVSLRGKSLQIFVTQRAMEKLAQRSRPLYVEAQAYFSCVVKKRLLFADTEQGDEIKVSENLYVTFHPVEAASCDPWEFAANYPEKRILNSPGAVKMAPRVIFLDFKKGRWQGELKL